MSQYATTADLARYGLPSSAITGISGPEQNLYLQDASAVADGYLRQQYSLPLSTYGTELTKYVCWIAAYDIISVRGFNPEGPDAVFQSRYDRAMSWLKDVQAGRASLSTTAVDQTADVDEGGPVIWSDPPRNW